MVEIIEEDRGVPVKYKYEGEQGEIDDLLYAIEQNGVIQREHGGFNREVGSSDKTKLKFSDGSKVIVRDKRGTITVYAKLAERDLQEDLYDAFLKYASGEEQTREKDQSKERRSGKTDRRSRYGGRDGDSATTTTNQTVFTPNFTKEEAGYHKPGEHSESGKDCRDCVHFIENGGCHMVQGEIEERAHCDDLYSDFGLFGTNSGGRFELTLAMWGDLFPDRFGRQEVSVAIKEMQETLERKVKR